MPAPKRARETDAMNDGHDEKYRNMATDTMTLPQLHEAIEYLKSKEKWETLRSLIPICPAVEAVHIMGVISDSDWRPMDDRTVFDDLSRLAVPCRTKTPPFKQRLEVPLEFDEGCNRGMLFYAIDREWNQLLTVRETKAAIDKNENAVKDHNDWIERWSLPDGHLLSRHPVTGLVGDFTRCNASTDLRFLAIAVFNEVRVFDLHSCSAEDKSPSIILQATSDSLADYAVDFERRKLYTASDHGIVSRFDLRTGEAEDIIRIVGLSGETVEVLQAICNPAKGELYVLTAESELVIVGCESFKITYRFRVHVKYPDAAFVAQDGGILITSVAGIVRLWDTATWRIRADLVDVIDSHSTRDAVGNRFRALPNQCVDAAVSADGRQVFAALGDRLHRFNVKQNVVEPGRAKQVLGRVVWMHAQRSTSRRRSCLLALTDDDALWIFDWECKYPLVVLWGFGVSVAAI